MDKEKVLELISECSITINILRKCVRPIEGHDDPASVDDCWDQLVEDLTRIKDFV